MNRRQTFWRNMRNSDVGNPCGKVMDMIHGSEVFSKPDDGIVGVF